MKKFEFIGAFFSPFKRPKLRFYLGKVAIGTPYFLPRKAVKDPQKPGYLKFVTKKIGFDLVGLGWKTKWTDTDYRFEWSPVISFVFFKWQFAITISATHSDHYWESWLYYTRNTDKTKSRKERIYQTQKDFPQIYTQWTTGFEKTKIDYYPIILKKRYVIPNKEENRDKILKDILK
jgi:hypothetical protein